MELRVYVCRYIQFYNIRPNHPYKSIFLIEPTLLFRTLLVVRLELYGVSF